MNHKLISTLLAVCVTSLGIAVGIAAQDARSHVATVASLATAAAPGEPGDTGQRPGSRFDASPYPAPQIDPHTPELEPAPTF